MTTAAVLGLTDVDALTVSMAREVAFAVSLDTAALAIAVGILANTAVKLGLALALGSSAFRRIVAPALILMMVAAALSIAVLQQAGWNQAEAGLRQVRRLVTVQIAFDSRQIPIEVRQPMLQQIVDDAQVDAAVEVNDAIAKARHSLKVFGEGNLDNAGAGEQIESLGVRSRRTQGIGGADVCGDFDARFDCQLQCVKDGVLTLAVLEKIVLRDVRESPQVPDVLADPALAVADDLGISDPGRESPPVEGGTRDHAAARNRGSAASSRR